MAYNPFPVTYPGYYNNPYYQQQQQQPQTIQQSGFINVRSMDEVYSWPIAPGNSITFYVESTPPQIATKTKGFSPLENPVIKEFDLMEKRATPEAPKTSAETANPPGDTYKDFALKSDLSEIWGEIDEIKKKLVEKKPVKARKVESDDEE